MPKAILVMDMPETYENCACKYPSYKDDALYDCAITGKEIQTNGGRYGKKPDWCPLRELPKKANHPAYCDNGRFDKGWNACLDKILK